jgi:hypothetical protein
MIDVSGPAGLSEPASVGVTVVTPEPEAVGDDPVVLFARPGAGLTVGYFTSTLPGQSTSEARWHADRGWVVVGVDPLGCTRIPRRDET